MGIHRRRWLSRARIAGAAAMFVVAVALAVVVFVKRGRWLGGGDTAPAMTIHAELSMGRWLFRYPGGGVSDELHLPEHGTVMFSARSVDGRFHAWQGGPWGGEFVMVIPDPNHTTTAQSTHRRLGRHRMRCVEPCGPRFSQCGATAVVEPDADFRLWLSRLPATYTPPASQPAPHAP